MGHHIAQHFDIYDMAEVKADFKAEMSQFMFILFPIRSNSGQIFGIIPLWPNARDKGHAMSPPKLELRLFD